jgi:hypothetical protein
MAKGTLIHIALLEPERLKDAVITDAKKNTKKYKQIALENKGRLIVKKSDYEKIKGIKESFYANSQAQDLMNGCQFELSAQWEHPTIGQCKARFDALATDGSYFIDLKTCSDIDPQSVGRQFVNMGYDIQYGWYRSGNEAINGKRATVYQFNIETSAPYDFTIDKVYPESCELGLSKAVEIATKYRDCERSGEFGGVRSHISMMQLPEWYKEQLDLSGDIPFGQFND